MKEISIVIIMVILLGTQYSPNFFYKKDKEEFKPWIRIVLLIAVIGLISSTFI